jgi:tetratricopeptide (TPR) repeat protein
MSRSRRCAWLLATLPALVARHAADTIRQTDGKTLDDVTIVEETLAEVSYKQGNAGKTVPADKVLAVEFSKFPRLLDEAEAAYADQDLAGAVELLDQFVGEELAESKERRKWAAPYAAWRAVQIRSEMSDLDAAVAAADRLIQGFPDSRYVPAAYLAKAGALQQMQAPDKALAVVQALEELIAARSLSKRWQLECRLSQLQVDTSRVGDTKRAQLSSIAAEASDFPSVQSRARVIEGESYLEEAEKRKEAAAELRGKARKTFEGIVSDPSADEETLAGAYSGLGDCAFYGADGNEAQLKEALLHYLRVVVLYDSQTRYVPKALFFAMRCFDLLEDRAGAVSMKAALKSRYPNSYWTAEAAKF